MLEQFIGKEVFLVWFLIDNEDNKEYETEEGILLYTRMGTDTDEYIIISLFKEDGEIEEFCVGDTESHDGTKYLSRLYIKDHEDIRQRILNISKPREITREELIDLEE